MFAKNKPRRIYQLNLLFIVIAFYAVSVLFACATMSHAKNLVRDAVNVNEVQVIKPDVPTNVSEVREIKNHVVSSEKGHTDMHFGGQIFTKSVVGGATQISPCTGCNIQLRLGSDTVTSSFANLTTDNSGFFQMKSVPLTLNSIVVSGPGYNSVQLKNLPFGGGINSIKVVLAAGNKQEAFIVSKNGAEFNWSKTQ